MIGLCFFQLVHAVSGSQIRYFTRIFGIGHIHRPVHGLVVVMQVTVIGTDIQVLHHVETCLKSGGELIALVFILMLAISKDSTHPIQNSGIAQ